jgi:RNA methyltransferase, TrmH family
MIPVSSNQNPIIKEVKALKVRKHREEKQLFFIEGLRFVEDALKERTDIQYVLVSEKFIQSNESNKVMGMIPQDSWKVYELPDKLFKEISDTENPQGIMAVLKMGNFTLDDIIKEDNNFLVILETIQDPGNMGTIIRTADAAGAKGIIVSKGSVDLYNPKVLRSTMGSVFHVPIYFSENLAEDLLLVKSKGILLYAAHLAGNMNYYEVKDWSNSGIIIGNEANGISSEISDLANTLVKIPMEGRAESLNASIAAGLLIYEVLRWRMCK